MLRYIEHQKTRFDCQLAGIFGLVSCGYEGAEVGSSGEDEPVDVIFLHVFDALLLFEEIGGDFGLSDDDEIGLSQEAAVE